MSLSFRRAVDIEGLPFILRLRVGEITVDLGGGQAIAEKQDSSNGFHLVKLRVDFRPKVSAAVVQLNVFVPQMPMLFGGIFAVPAGRMPCGNSILAA